MIDIPNIDAIKPPSIMIECPECKSKALNIGTTSSTLAYYQPFTDDDGRLHHHDGNITTSHYTCRKCEHSFTESSTGSCWCGWPNNDG